MYKNNPTIQNSNLAQKQLENIKNDIYATMDNDKFWVEAAKFGNDKVNQLASEVVELENKIDKYLIYFSH